MSKASELIVGHPNVCGGDPCIKGTRIMVWILVVYRHRLKRSDKQLLEMYPQLSQEDLDAAWAYYESHREEIDNRIREDEKVEV